MVAATFLTQAASPPCPSLLLCRTVPPLPPPHTSPALLPATPAPLDGIFPRRKCRIPSKPLLRTAGPQTPRSAPSLTRWWWSWRPSPRTWCQRLQSRPRQRAAAACSEMPLALPPRAVTKRFLYRRKVGRWWTLVLVMWAEAGISFLCPPATTGGNAGAPRKLHRSCREADPAQQYTHLHATRRHKHILLTPAPA